ncbi:ST3 beta-galactoside alpha-2,3-sialyltransferase 6 [Homo sapiens]|uniref:ST3 beta-galactoside alpha-2,3-sialyltransferase 6 n=1 Tax=Homo sapiens TaxID=9606 RepID=F2Z2F4_HUMAN|nr:ST3 beta-galactoside alpha-2,3-sialyltransferase 6 [Homo sapiens]KAI2530606.1 ST3 beta-galactoside alpha-2,3-sialyltransferase 6 [Homo sapiens]KAI2530607.1 ST3 beta-galactoside alpha-2,3-sialyltransferase 6 [Homo sapiens]KAI2530608.1 ST3 beta-galactoside alpha-2,3-sialyltransferase 6 [Homo sapiens]KAI4030661.1 ST3 beta-galactoside alpha-2,3-sialyltransferase 6 [Homo sapiens]
MRGYLVAIFLSAVFLYYVLHCILWGTNVYWVAPVEMKRRNKIQPCLSKPAFASLLSQSSAYILRKGIEELNQTSILFTQVSSVSPFSVCG